VKVCEKKQGRCVGVVPGPFIIRIHKNNGGGQLSMATALNQKSI
jgi:hypothetical protein